jgi:hypothetical protein
LVLTQDELSEGARMRNTNEKYRVYLSAQQRLELETLCRGQCVPASQSRRAKILLMADESHAEGHCQDAEIAEVVGLCERQVVRIRQKFVRDGMLPAITRKRRCRPGTTPKFDGKAEARLVALCCSTPPEGRQRWTLQLLADELARLCVVTSVCPETVRQCLKKTGSSLGERRGSAFPKRIVRAS